MRRLGTTLTLGGIFLLAGVGWALSDDPNCYKKPDDAQAEFCGGSVSQNCANIATAQDCNGAERITRVIVTFSCTSTLAEIACVTDFVRCWTKWECKWIQLPGGGGACVNRKQLDYAEASVKVQGECYEPR